MQITNYLIIAFSTMAAEFDPVKDGIDSKE